MDPTKHNAAALHARVDKICNALIGHFANVAGAVKEDDPKTKEDPKENDYSSTAQKELTINEEIASFIRAGQDLSVLIRELQEVWLFGGLDTLIHEAHTDEAKAFRIATLMEELAKGTAKPKDVEKGMGKQAGFGSPSVATDSGEETAIHQQSSENKRELRVRLEDMVKQPEIEQIRFELPRVQQPKVEKPEVWQPKTEEPSETQSSISSRTLSAGLSPGFNAGVSLSIANLSFYEEDDYDDDINISLVDPFATE